MREQLELLNQVGGDWYAVQCVRTYREGLIWIVANSFNVYIIDVDIAGEDPANIIRVIRKVDDDALIISVSSHTSLATLSLEAGSDLFMPRSKTYTEIRSTIDDLIDKGDLAKRPRMRRRNADH